MSSYATCFGVHGHQQVLILNPLKAELNPICHLLPLLGAHHILHVSRIRVNKGTKEKHLWKGKF
jgi:hypothetical protein